METSWFYIGRAALAILGGLGIGYGFGLMQAAAQRRYAREQLSGKLNNGWSVMPGSGARVALLLVLLIAIQVICPILFMDGIQWWVSAGVGLGYGAQLFAALRLRRAQFKLETEA